MIYKDKWYTIAESQNFPAHGELSITLGPSTISLHASITFSNALISLISYSIVPGLTIDVRIQKTENSYFLDVRYATLKPDTGFVPEILIISGSTWLNSGIIEGFEYNTICQLSNIRDSGGLMNPWVYAYIDSSLGYMIGPGEKTIIKVNILQGWYDITDKMTAWQWSRSSGDYASDLAWNIAHTSLTTEAEISYDDLGNSAALNASCVFTIQAVFEDAAITTMFKI